MNASRKSASPCAAALVSAVLVAGTAAAMAGCSGAARDAGGVFPDSTVRGSRSGHRPTSAPSASPIKHVVIIIQENRSFDNLFQAYPGANTASSGVTSTGQTVQLQPIQIHGGFDVGHGLADFLAACDGGPQGNPCKNDAFDLERNHSKKYVLPMYSYVPQADTTLYWALAQQYVIADNTFQSHLDASFVGHQYLIAAQAQHAVDLPHGVWGCPAGVATLNPDRTIGPLEKACFVETVLSDEIDGAGLTWKMYGPKPHDPGNNWIAFMAIQHVRHGPEWKTNIVRPETQILSDAQSGNLPTLSWVIPRYYASDHEGAANTLGEQWVSSVVNAIGQSQYWNSTAIFVVWDDWGGFYDHVPPQYLDYDGLGFRVPLLVISPYSKQNYVSHVQYEFGSILQFVEDTFGLGRLSASDTRANSLIPDCFNFNSAARKFKPLPTISRRELMRQLETKPTVIPEDADFGD